MVEAEKSDLLLLEPVSLESECTTVFCDRTNHAIGNTARDFCFNFERHVYAGAHEPSKVLDHFLGDLPGVATHPRGVKLDRTVESTGLRWLGANANPWSLAHGGITSRPCCFLTRGDWRSGRS